MQLPEKIREELKKPLGILIKDPEVTKENVLKKIPKNTFIITVGDATTEKMIKFGLIPSLQIVDAMEKRNKRKLPQGEAKTVFVCSNPAGEITEQSMLAIKKAYSGAPPVRIIVNGEEDLLVLPAVLYSPDNSVVMYGQPNEGLVLVINNENTRKRAKSLIESMN